ncbi:DNA cytosine methyltransferase [Geodermatophilus nigrescens]
MLHSQVDHPLRQAERPNFEEGIDPFRLVDLFAGCGGLTLGFAQALASRGRRLEVALAVDFESSATDVYKRNFRQARVETASVEAFFDGELGTELTETEQLTAAACGSVDALIGGPPCQGHSNLNNRTRRDDPKNALYARMARAAEVLRPAFVMIENVPAVEHDRGDVVGITRTHLETLGYTVATATVSLNTLGVAQTRRRHVLLAALPGKAKPDELLATLANRTVDSGIDLRWAIGDLETLPEPTGYDVPPRASATNTARMEYLIAHGLYDLPNAQRPKCHQDEHSYKSMYGRLRWTRPAQTITSGFGSIGQGRYMHPSQARALTAHEAARIQGFPDYFDFSAVTKRADLATMIGNAVPPPLSREIALNLIAPPATGDIADADAVSAPQGDLQLTYLDLVAI